jgi:N-acetylmuramoyl-L-alanine amidase CwlA
MIKQMIAPLSAARSGRKLKQVIGVTIHNTGNTAKGSNAINHGKYLQGSGSVRQASWHYAVDETVIVQSIPEDEVAWHAGDGLGDGNLATIAIEICMNSDGDLLRATDNAARLTADILQRHGVRKIYQHYDWSGKSCPQMLREGKPYDWATFVKKVEVYMDIKDVTLTIGNKPVEGKLIDGVTYAPLRAVIDAIKSELEVTWDKSKGAGVKL